MFFFFSTHLCWFFSYKTPIFQLHMSHCNIGTKRWHDFIQFISGTSILFIFLCFWCSCIIHDILFLRIFTFTIVLSIGNLNFSRPWQGFRIIIQGITIPLDVLCLIWLPCFRDIKASCKPLCSNSSCVDANKGLTLILQAPQKVQIQEIICWIKLNKWNITKY